MSTLKNAQRMMNRGRAVMLADGRTAKIVRLDTVFPSNDTVVTVWTETPAGPGVTKVALEEVLGPAPARASNA